MFTQGEPCVCTASCVSVVTATVVAFTFVDGLFDDRSYGSVFEVHTLKCFGLTLPNPLSLGFDAKIGGSVLYIKEFVVGAL